jgi:hypothetical protein
MNFAYLLVPRCNGRGENYHGLQKLMYSYESLRKFYSNIQTVYLYIGHDSSSIHRIPDIIEWAQNQEIVLVDIGALTHSFSTMYKGGQNPYRLNILIEKIRLLQNFPNDEEICFVDIDTEFLEKFTNYRFDPQYPIFHARESILLHVRNLRTFFQSANIEVDANTNMYNTGIIFLPKEKRASICKEAYDLVLEMNKYPDNTRIANDLDEQIALSIVASKHFSTIRVLKDVCKHHWPSVHAKVEYWKKSL